MNFVADKSSQQYHVVIRSGRITCVKELNFYTYRIHVYFGKVKKFSKCTGLIKNLTPLLLLKDYTRLKSKYVTVEN